MKVLSLLQPWATLVAIGAKQYECRSWQTTHRGPLLIHASAKRPTKREKDLFERAPYFNRFITDTNDLPYGAIIAKVDLEAIYKTEAISHALSLQELAFDDYSPNRFAWKLVNLQPLELYLPVKGTLGLWTYNGLI